MTQLRNIYCDASKKLFSMMQLHRSLNFKFQIKNFKNLNLNLNKLKSNLTYSQAKHSCIGSKHPVLSAKR